MFERADLGHGETVNQYNNWFSRGLARLGGVEIVEVTDNDNTIYLNSRSLRKHMIRAHAHKLNSNAPRALDRNVQVHSLVNDRISAWSGDDKTPTLETIKKMIDGHWEMTAKFQGTTVKLYSEPDDDDSGTGGDAGTNLIQQSVDGVSQTIDATSGNLKKEQAVMSDLELAQQFIAGSFFQNLSEVNELNDSERQLLKDQLVALADLAKRTDINNQTELKDNHLEFLKTLGQQLQQQQFLREAADQFFG